MPKYLIVLIVLTCVFALASCKTVSKYYQTAADTNDLTLEITLDGLCSSVADLSAERKLSLPAQEARVRLCVEWSDLTK